MKTRYQFFKKILLILLIIGMIPMSSFAQTITTVNPSNSNIQWFGRWDFTNPNSPYCSWPSLYLKLNFTGTAIAIKISDNTNSFTYSIDGAAPVKLSAPLSSNKITLASGLAAGTHSLMFSRRSEGGLTYINGFEITDGDITTPDELPCIKFEFVGNSISCGFRNEIYVGDGQTSATANNQNSYEAFGPKLARKYDGDYRVEAHSGQGMVMNLSNSMIDAQKGKAITAADEFEYKHRVSYFGTNYDAPYDFAASKWAPDFYFCCLGTNDWNNNANNPDVTKADFINRYNQHLDFVYSKYPNTTVIIFGMLLNAEPWISANTYLKEMVDARKLAGDDIYFINPLSPSAWLASATDYGNDWTHPTVEGGDKIATKIKTIMDQTPAIKAKIDALIAGCNVDCHGDKGGTAYLDNCNVCVGGNTGQVTTCTKDCNGDMDGTASIDDCGVCSGGLSGKTPNSTCVQDCNGDWKGTAYLDNCSTCVGGNTGEIGCGYAKCRAIEFTNTTDYGNLGGVIPSTVANGEWKVTGNNTGQWDAFSMDLGTGVDLTQSVSQKMFIRAKASSNVLIRPTFEDSKGIIASHGDMLGGNWTKETSNVLQLTTTWQEFTIDFTGNLRNQYGCGCDLLASEIRQIYVEVNPGWASQWPLQDQWGNDVTSGFTGSIEIDYVRVADNNCGLTTTGIDPVHTTESTLVYPNPFQDELTVEDYEGAYTISSIDGKVLEAGIVTDKTQIGKKLSSGTYLLNLKNDGQNFNKLIIKK